MAAFDTTRTAYGSSLAVGKISAFATAVFAAVAAWNDARKTRKALSQLTDRELNDIGLTRGDLDDINDGFIVR
ncbi:MAG: DUF1127 domain-containing protein [Pseudomonadota bacterium]